MNHQKVACTSAKKQRYTCMITPSSDNLLMIMIAQNLLTVVDLHNEIYLEAISKFSLHLLQKLQDQTDLAPPDTEIVVHLRDNGEDLCFGYYLASWERRCVFWFEEVSYDLITDEVRVCSTESHIGACPEPSITPPR